MAGFTLVESLIALAMVALLAAGLSAALGTLTKRTAERQTRAWLVELARSVGEEYRVTGDPALLAGRMSDGTEWRIETRAVSEPAAPGAQISRFTVTAEWPDLPLAVALEFARDAGS